MSKFPTHTTQPANELGTLYIPNLYSPADGDIGVDGNLGIINIKVPQIIYVKKGPHTYPGQLFELFSNDQVIPIAHTFVMPADVQSEWLPILLPEGSIKPQWLDPLVCRINHTGVSTLPPCACGSISIYRQAMIRIPANRDTKGWLSTCLTMCWLTVSAKSEPAKGSKSRSCLTFTWRKVTASGCAGGDQQITYSVSVTDLGREIHLVVPYAKIMAARDAIGLNVRLQVRGPTGNFTEPAARWSAPSEVLVYAQRDILREPFTEVDPQTGVIDLDKLQGKPLIASVFASPDYFERQDTLEFFFTATNAQGELSTHSKKQTVDRTNRIFDFEVPYAFMADLNHGHAKLHYVLHKYVQPMEMYSQAAYVSIEGADVEWPAPYLNEAMPFADTRATEVDIYVYVPYQAAWRPQDLITLVWVLPDPEGTVEYRSSCNAGARPEHGAIEFVLPAEQTKRFVGRPSQMYYEANNSEGVSLGVSARKPLQVGERWAPMAAPVVDKVIGHQLDPDLIGDGVWVTIPSPTSRPGGSLALVRPQ
ncbi:hypothetical protein JNO13_01590 [Pseudomonas sp. 1079]|nr:hypothetical protein [Pseudomonas sp. 1079]MBN1079616.1 hypothetical protein [Pseudomonas sp. 1079]